MKNLGQVVFVNKGNFTVKEGVVVGERITKFLDKLAVVEYSVKWYADDDGGQSLPVWYNERDVFTDPVIAFGG